MKTVPYEKHAGRFSGEYLFSPMWDGPDSRALFLYDIQFCEIDAGSSQYDF